jgi:hypothetical protein
VQLLLQWKSNEYYTTCVFIFVALDIQHAMGMHHVICGLPRSTIFFIISQTVRLKKKLLNIKCVFRVSLQLMSETFFVLRITERDVIKKCKCLHVKYSSCPRSMKFEVSRYIFEKYSNIRCHENPSTGS